MDRIRQGIPLLLALTTMGAVCSVAGPYFSIFSSDHRSRSYAVDEVSDDSSDHAMTRGLVGGAIGLAIGIAVMFKKDEEDA